MKGKPAAPPFELGDRGNCGYCAPCRSRGVKLEGRERLDSWPCEEEGPGAAGRAVSAEVFERGGTGEAGEGTLCLGDLIGATENWK